MVALSTSLVQAALKELEALMAVIPAGFTMPAHDLLKQIGLNRKLPCTRNAAFKVKLGHASIEHESTCAINSLKMQARAFGGLVSVKLLCMPHGRFHIADCGPAKHAGIDCTPSLTHCIACS